MTDTKNITRIIRELKEFSDMEDHGINEVTTDEGKITYREVLSNRFDSTAFKKDFLDVYESYLRQTSSMRFTLN